MTELVEFLTADEFLVVYITASIACILCSIIYLVEKNSIRGKRRHNTRELNKLVEQIHQEVEEEEVPQIIYEEPVLQPIVEESIEPVIIEKIEEELEYTTIEPDQETAQMELQKLTEQLQEQEKESNVTLTSFEEYQEENAIISLDEYLKQSAALYEKNERKQYEEENTLPITIQELEQKTGLTSKKLEDTFVLSEVVSIEEEKKEEPKRFKSSPIISPIYGIEKEEKITLENTATYAKLDDEVRKTNEFLMTLKELQQKLDNR